MILLLAYLTVLLTLTLAAWWAEANRHPALCDWCAILVVVMVFAAVLIVF